MKTNSELLEKKVGCFTLQKSPYITMSALRQSLLLLTTNPKTNLCTIQFSNRLNVPEANFEQSIDCWIDLLKKQRAQTKYLSLLLVTFAHRAPMMIT